MAGIGQVAGDDLKAQLNEYHVLVAEIIGALTADVTQNTNRITRLESQVTELIEETRSLQKANQLLLKEVLVVRESKPGTL
jgi:cell division protein FtsL